MDAHREADRKGYPSKMMVQADPPAASGGKMSTPNLVRYRYDMSLFAGALLEC